MPEPNLGAKTRWKTQIELSLANGNFAEAMTLIHKAFAEFADDPEFLTLEEQVTHGRDRSVTVFQMMEEGRQLCADQNFEEGVSVLRGAYSLDERNALVRSTLIDNLLCQALAVLDSDLPLAERLAKEANALDPENPVNQSVAQSIQEHQRMILAEQCRPPASERSVDESQRSAAQTLGDPGFSGKSEMETRSSGAAGGAPAASAIQPAGASNGASIGKSMPGTSGKAAEVVLSQPVEAAPANIPPSEPKSPARPQAPELPGGALPTSAAEARIMSGPSGQPTGQVPMQTTASSPAQPHRSAQPQTSPSSTPATLKRETRPVSSVHSRKGAPSRATPRLVWAASGIAALALVAVLIRPVIQGKGAGTAPVLVAIRTNPPGAAVRIDGQYYDTAQEVSLMPGSYRIEAALDGYQPVVRDVDVNQFSQEPIELDLLPAVPMLRISTDFASGTVSLDGQPAEELQNGQFAIDSIAPGEHSLRVSSGRLAEAVIPLMVASAGLPVLSSAITAKNLRVFLLVSFDGQGRVYSSFGPASLKLDGQPVGAISMAKPLQLAGLTAESHEFRFGEGNDQRKISLDVNSARSIFLFLTSDRNVGTLEIVSNEGGFQLQINGKPAKISTQRGRYFVYNVDAKSASIQISKAGFDSDPSAQEVVIRKGEIARVSFKLAPTPTTATLHVIGALPGTRMSVDGTLHELQPDGSVTATVAPGEHGIEFTRQGFKPKTLHISARSGQTIALGGSDVQVNDALTGKLTITTRSPANATVVLRRGGTEIHVSDREAELPEGDYTLIATASGYRDESRPVRIAERAPAVVDVKLVAIPQVVRMEGWDDPKGWKLEDGWHKRKGGMFVLFKGSSSKGTIQFTARHKGRQLPIFRGGQIRWVVNYVDAQNYDLYELDGQKLAWKRFVDGKPGAEKQAPHGVKIQDATYRLTMEVGSGQLAGKIFDGKTWKPLPLLDGSNANPREGKFGFLLPNNEEMWLTDFVFKPNE